MVKQLGRFACIVVLVIVMCGYCACASAVSSIGGGFKISDYPIIGGESVTVSWNLDYDYSVSSVSVSISAVDANGKNVKTIWSSSDAGVRGEKQLTIGSEYEAIKASALIFYKNGRMSNFQSEIVPIQIAVSHISVSPDTITIRPGETYVVEPVIYPSNATNQQIAYTSKNSNIATVDQDGTITAIAAGTTTIYADAKDGSGVRGYLYVTVGVPLERIILEDEYIVQCGHLVIINPVFEPADAAGVYLEWTSSDPDVVWARPGGLVAGEAGTALITVTSNNGVVATTTVRVFETLPVRVPGDANEDGVADIFDALLVLKFDSGWDVPLNQSNADVNADGVADIFDALLLLKYDSGWDVELK